MKHPVNMTLLLVVMFLTAQLAGLLIINEYIDIAASHETGITVKNTEEYNRIGIEPPEVENESISFVFILGSVLMGTVLILLIIQFGKRRLWKAWYLFAVMMALVVALNPFIFKAMALIGIVNLVSPYLITVLISLGLSLLKIFRQNLFVHNATEILIYGGLAALLVPILNLFSVAILLLAISIYDAYAVWKSKHMVKMAEFQRDSNLFAGFSFPYAGSKKQSETKQSPVSAQIKAEKKAGSGPKGGKITIAPDAKSSSPTSAILGGGDIAFPLLFAGVVMKTTGSYLYPLVVALATTLALFVLFWRAEKGKFYPAMPFLSVGCFLGLFACWLISLI